MVTNPFKMSGIVSLNDLQVRFLSTMGLGNVPNTMTTAQMQELLAKADEIAEGLTDEMVAKMTKQELAEMREQFGLKASYFARPQR